ncbi:hypothetical protein [Paenibacillus sp. WLX2291]|uniref:hypothetical protein n=1 Tax=Paenibacillus sp. WLX2291 TaxID=3296934 RepID=UPI003983E0A8
MRQTSKKLILATALALGVTAVVPLGHSASAAADQEKRIVVATYYLDKQVVKDMAANAEALRNYSDASRTLAKLTKIPYAKVAIIASGLSAKASARQEFIDAAKNNKRIKVVITDYANYHTSYSTQMELIPVN